MDAKNNDFSNLDPDRLLRSPQARRLMELLQQMDPSVLQQATELASRGEAAQAKELLSPLLDEDEVQRLTREMRDRNG